MTSSVRATSRPPATARRRRLTVTVAAALLGAPLLFGSAASAEADATVTFHGGCGLLGSGLGARSSPDLTDVSVTVGGTLRFANQLGQPATLRLDGEAVAEVPSGGAAEVVFHDGPVTAAMQLSCLLGGSAGTVTVAVVHPRPEPSDPSDPGDRSPTSPSPGAGSSGGGAPGGGSSGGTASGGGSGWTGGTGQTGQSTGAGSSPSDQVPAEWWSAGQAPPPATGPDDRSVDDERDRSDELGDRWGVAIDPGDGSGMDGDPATVDQESADEAVVAGQLSRTAGSSDDGPVGLLALIATVCVVGVSAGAVRALVTQRANRAEWA
jgi:hypothetical protein